MSTIIHCLNNWAEEEPHVQAQLFKQNGNWTAYTTRDYRDRIFWLAEYLKDHGVSGDDVITLYSYNCAEWPHLDLAGQMAGAITAGLYPNSSPQDLRFVFDQTGSKIAGVQNKNYYDKLIAANPKLKEQIELFIVFEGDASFSDKAIGYDQALEKGKALAKGKTIQYLLDEMDPKRGSFLIYTSGTTGNPKGALLSQDNVVFASDSFMHHLQLTLGEHNLFSFLPMCHIAERMHSMGVGIYCRYPVSYCSAFENVAKELPEVSPSLLLCVPRVWEKFLEGVENKLAVAPEKKRKLVRWAMKVGREYKENQLDGRSPSITQRLLFRLADKLVLSKIKKALGIQRMEIAGSGAAALPPHVALWFRGLGIELLEIFGQTESTALFTAAVRGKDCVGTVGRPAFGTEFKIAEDGEICTKGRHVFLGYYKNDAATKETVIDGWLHSGDLGKETDKGLIKIVGRKKEIMKTSGGKMVAPTRVEDQIRESPLVSQVCMVGDGKKYFSALITLPEQELEKLKSSGALHNGVVTDEKMVGDIQRVVSDVNSKLASYEQVKKFTVLSREFSIEEGEMTPTLKMKRANIEKNFEPLITKMYSQ